MQGHSFTMGSESRLHAELAAGEPRAVGTRREPADVAVFLITLGFFFISGACGLLYQVVWTRKLVLLFGTAAYAVSTVLFIFFLGLGLGSLWGGRLAERVRRPLSLYGWFELGIGLWAVLFIVLIDRGEGIVAAALRYFAFSRWAAVSLRVLLALVFLIVPVTLMGATLPLLAKFVAAQRRVAGLRIGALYSLNTFGAVMGCCLTGFFLIAALGYTKTTWLGAAANAIIGLLALLLGRAMGPLRAPGKPVRLSAYEQEEPPPPLGVALVVTTFAVSGCCALALEVLWTRLLTIVFVGTTYAFTTMLTSLLCGIAVGSAAASLIADRCRNPIFVFGLVETLAGLACLATLAVFARVPEIFGEMSRDAGYAWAALVRVKFLVSFLVLFGPTFLFGATFPLVVKAVAGFQGKMGQDVGTLYCANTCGGLIGALAGGFLFIPLLGTHRGILVLGLTVSAFGTVVAGYGMGRTRGLAVAAALVLLGLFAGQRFASGSDVGLILTQGEIPEHDTLLHYREGVEGTVAVSQEPQELVHGSRVLWINGVQATASIEKGVKMNRFQGALPLLFNREPREVLLMCFGSGITCGTLAQYPFDRIDAVEISHDVLEAAHWFAEDNLGVMQNSRVRFLVDDGRNFLLTTGNRYDFITFEPMPLALAGVSTFYTREYYELCSQRLTPGGLVSQWVPLHSLNLEVVRSLVATFLSVFSESCAWFINADLFLIGSDEPLRIDWPAALGRLNFPAVRDALGKVELDEPPELISYFFMGKRNLERFAAGGRIMTDDRPWAEFEAPKLIYERSVGKSLEALRQFFESPATMLRADGLAREDFEEIVAVLDRRHRAKQRDLEGIITYYGGMLVGDPEQAFREALEIEPGDRTARYYLRDLARHRCELFIRWEEFDKAVEYLEKLVAVAPDEPLFQLLLGDVFYAQEQFSVALEHYTRHLVLGGGEPRAKQRLESIADKGGETAS